MKTLTPLDEVKIVQGLVGGVAWAVIIAIGMILGAAVTAQAARVIPEFADHDQKDAHGPQFERFGAEPAVSQNGDLESRLLDESRMFPGFNERLLQTNVPFQISEVPPSRSAGKGRWNFVKIRAVQENGKTPIVRFEF